MTGLFANQFSYANAYNPVGLDTGTPQVGATLGRKPPRRPTEDPTPSRVPAKNPNTAEEGAQLGQSLENGMGRPMGNNMGLAQGAGKLSQSTLNALSQSEMAMGGAGAGALAGSQKGGADPGIHTTPGLTPAQVSAMTQAAQGIGPVIAHSAPPPDNNPLGGFGHWLAHTFDSGRHTIASGASHANNFIEHNPVMHDLGLGPGLPPGESGNSGGLMGILNPVHQTDAPIEPTSVQNPVRNAPGEIGQGAPKVIQGQVEGNPSIDVLSRSAQRALPRAYTSMEDFTNLMRGSGAGDIYNPTQFSVPQQASSATQDVGSAASDAGGFSWESLIGDLADAFA